MAVERAELRLVWPPALFAAEAQALLDAGTDDRETTGWLLAEAFHDDRGWKLYKQLDLEPIHLNEEQVLQYHANGDLPPAPSKDTLPLVRGLIADAAVLPRFAGRRYFSARHKAPAAPLTIAQAKSAYEMELNALSWSGYLDEAEHYPDRFPWSAIPSGQQLRQDLVDVLEVASGDWPPVGHGELCVRVERGMSSSWSDETFFDLIEAVHDRAARPRRRWRSEQGGFGIWEYGDHTRLPGQAVYRWRVNTILDRSEIDLRLADTGEEAGLLVRTASDNREALLAEVAEAAVDRDTRQHAIALFRARSAGIPDKRSAVVALAGLLEARRRLLKNELLSKDEGALFTIANQFDLRHRNADQRGNYDEAFLDWIFWWYLATLDLTDQLLARQVDGSTAGSS